MRHVGDMSATFPTKVNYALIALFAVVRRPPANVSDGRLIWSACRPAGPVTGPVTFARVRPNWDRDPRFQQSQESAGLGLVVELDMWKQ